MCVSRLLIGVFVSLAVVLPAGLPAQTVLVDFASSAGQNVFGMTGWNALLKSDAVTYTAEGPGGLVADAAADEYADFQGVRGDARAFRVGERVVVTWFNRSQETIRFTSRISFTDADQPDGGVSSGRWYTMRRADQYRETWTEIGPGETARTMFAIRGTGVHKTDSSYGLVNVNLAIEWGQSDRKQHLVCDRIELFDDADVTPPAAPRGVQATDLTDSKIRIVWEAPADDVGVYDYLVYVNDEIEAYSREAVSVLVFLEPSTDYRIGVTARDVMGNESERSWQVTVRTAPYQGAKSLVGPHGISYLGAFRLPDDFYWGGEAIAYHPEGDGGGSGGGAADGFPGSLFVTNVNQPENGLVGEVSIPAPVTGGSLDGLPVATLLRAPTNIRPSLIDAWDYVDIWRTGLEYLADEQRLYSSWSIHYAVSGEKHASISATAADLSSGPRLGPWFLGDPAMPPIDAQANDWLFSLPTDWADANASGRRLVTGRCRDGGLSGLGPTLFAFAPVGSAVPPAETRLDFTTLLEYGPVEGTDNYVFPDAIDGYKHSDDWRGACWLTTGGQSAVAVIGRKAHGDNWYGYHGESMPNDWVYVDVPYPEFGMTDPDGKGWRAHRCSPMIVLYNPAQLADVAAGRLASHEPQPYAAVRLDPGLFFTPENEIFSTAFDPRSRMLYVTEFVRDPDGALVVHVFRVDAVATSAEVVPAPQGIDLQLYPNPVHGRATIRFTLPSAGEVQLQVMDGLGRVVTQLAEGIVPDGSHQTTWDAAALGLPPGMYVIKLWHAGRATVRPFLLVR
ncbi:MAG: T9SS type A sorting domain-containing protein [Bacteroidetes bacterium]|nr:T9SS type A sorting domain-containing protein [Bacteroidota bacterium]